MQEEWANNGAEHEARQEEVVQPAWLTYRQARVYAGLPRDALRRLIDAGEIRGVRLGRAVRISRASLDAYMEGQTWQPEEEDGDA